ncbi:MAG: hypothetical protein Q8P67_19340 [archaeon]|nr:hypothetical protein [archaeon]
MALVNPSAVRLRLFLSLIGPVGFVGCVFFFEFLFSGVHPLWLLASAMGYAVINYLVIVSFTCSLGYRVAVFLGLGSASLVYLVLLLFKSFVRWKATPSATNSEQPFPPPRLEIDIYDESHTMVSSLSKQSDVSQGSLDHESLLHQQHQHQHQHSNQHWKMRLAKLGWRRFGVGFGMLAIMLMGWVACTFFARLLQINSESSTWVLVLYSFSTFVLFQILVAVNNKLPSIQQVQHISCLLEVLFNLYYRFFFFFGTPNWYFLIINSVLWTTGQWFSYPVQLSRPYFDRVRSRLVVWSERSKATRWIFAGPHYEPNLSYDTFVLMKSVQYHFAMLADYYAIVCFFVWTPIAAYAWQPNTSPDSSITDQLDVSKRLSPSLIYALIFALCWRMLNDFLIRFFTRKVLKIDISSSASNQTLKRSSTRILYSLYILFFSMLLLADMIPADYMKACQTSAIH